MATTLPAAKDASSRDAFERQYLVPQRQAAIAIEKAMIENTEITLFTIDPYSEFNPPKPGVPVLIMENHAWGITGTATLREKDDIAALASSFRENIDHNSMVMAACFSPRHALRFKRGKDVVTLLICFECLICEVSGFKELETDPLFNLAYNYPNTAVTWNRIYRKTGLLVSP